MANKKATTGKNLEDIKETISKNLGKGVIGYLSDDALEIERISTGILAVDKIIGGGFARGTFVECYGNPGAGKSLIAQAYSAQVQALDEKVVYVDLEHSLDPRTLALSGVDIGTLVIAQPETTEDTLGIIETLLDATDVGAIIIDSVAGLVPRSEMVGDYGDSHVGLQARLMSQGLRKLRTKMTAIDSRVTVVWVNQMRSLIGNVGYGPQTTTTGGKALGFWCSTRLEVSRVKNLGTADNVIGHQVKVKVTKNRRAPPFQTGTFDVLYESGVSNGSTLLDLAIEAKLVKVSGSWYADADTGESLGQGRVAAAQRIEDDAELYDKFVQALI